MKDGGFKRVTTAAVENGTGLSQHEQLTKDLVISEPVYVYIYLSNEGVNSVDVFFDDFKVEHVKGPVVQMEDYYPFGLTYNSYIRESSVPNRWKFQGQEHVDDLGLNWDSFKWRNHQPDIGRFFNVDPLSEKYVYNSPYAFSENKVTSHIELEGLEAVAALKNEIKKVETTVMNWLGEAKETIGNAVDKAVNFADSFDKESTDKQQKGVGINIYDEGGTAGPDNKYAPAPDSEAKNYDVPSTILDALGAVGESPEAPSPDDIGQRIENLASAVEKTNGAKNAAEAVLNKQDTIVVTNNKGPNGESFNVIYVIKGNDTIDNKSYVPSSMLPKKK